MQLVTKTAFDSMPAQRRRVIELLGETGKSVTKQVALALGLPTTTARRTLEDLAAHGVVLRESEGEGKSDTWRLSAWTEGRLGQP
jgi:predicted ArsR family transcriptional regulator